ncbi:protein of unknown function [Modestobacter italicus]|uniref:Uncharacterized protein n=1 Tax=Modestobacter italicus (strain DSM 44449 / CECT 9708 / BC 501) TaxID=2732864 RepID=I4F2Q8_MODI5|nr:hypothetical protein [Modestobacter marinus]CCH89921.1 protein of unknown function [Modestobacter marinus]
MQRKRSSLPPPTRGIAAGPATDASDRPLPQDALDWSWPPYAPVEADDEPFDTGQWAPSSVVSHPRLRVGRWTLLYRRSA